MLPPKKNQAARENQEEDTEKKTDKEMENVQGNSVKSTEEEKEKTVDGKDSKSVSQSKKGFKGWAEVDSDDEEFKKVNIFDVSIVGGKRKHFVNRHEEVLRQWIGETFVAKEGRKCAFSQCYSVYLDLCMRENINTAMEEHAFIKLLKKEFPNGFGHSENSKHKDDIRESKKYDKSEVKADTLKLKMKDVLNQAFQGLNNPVDGIIFSSLKKYMIVKFPALQLDQKPHVLLRGLQNGVYFGYIELLRGVGKAGKYRWYDPDRKEEKKSKKKGADKAEGEEDKKGEEEKKDSTDDSGTADDAEKKDDDGEAKANGDAKKKPVNTAGGRRKRAAATAAKNKKKGKKSAPRKRYKYIVHSDPQKIDDTFPLALTFLAEPKCCSAKKIFNYIEKFYDSSIKQEKVLKALENGCEKNFWFSLRGSGLNAVYELNVEKFDPTDDDDMVGKIINAITASTEPKSASAKTLKEYIVEFFPTFKIGDRPHLYKRALERCANKGLIRQLSGIGATGTFELVESFVPSPLILQGKDTAEDYEGSDSSDDSSGDEGISETHEVDISLFQNAYKPRPTKRRGKVREVTKYGGFDKNAAYQEATMKQAVSSVKKTGKKTKSKPKSSLKVPKRRQESSSEEEDSSSSEEEEEEDSSDEDDSTYGSDDKAEKYKPRPTQSRGRARGPPPTKASLKQRPPPKAKRGRKIKKAVAAAKRRRASSESNSSSESSVEEIPAPKKRSSVGASQKRKVAATPASKRKGSAASAPPAKKSKKAAATPTKSTAKRGKTSAAASGGKKKKAARRR